MKLVPSSSRLWSSLLVLPLTLASGAALAEPAPDKPKPELRLGGFLQPELVFFPADEAEAYRDEFRMRRLRLLLRAKWGDFAFRLVPELSNGQLRIMDANIDLTLYKEGEDSLVLRVGKDKTPISMDLLSSSSTLSLIERGPTAALAPTRDFGLGLLGRFGPVEAQVMLADGAADGGNVDANIGDDFEVSGRVGVHLGPAFVGVSGSWGEARGATVATYRTPGRATLRSLPSGDDAPAGAGERWRAGAHARLETGPVVVWAEGLLSKHDVQIGGDDVDLGSAGAYELGVSVLATGGDNAWDSMKAPGTIELAARFGALDENPFDATPVLDEGGVLSEGVGYLTGAFAVTWHIDAILKLAAGYEVTAIEDRDTEHFIGLRLQAYLLEKL